MPSSRGRRSKPPPAAAELPGPTGRPGPTFTALRETSAFPEADSKSHAASLAHVLHDTQADPRRIVLHPAALWQPPTSTAIRMRATPSAISDQRSASRSGADG